MLYFASIAINTLRVVTIRPLSCFIEQKGTHSTSEGVTVSWLTKMYHVREVLGMLDRPFPLLLNVEVVSQLLKA